MARREQIAAGGYTCHDDEFGDYYDEEDYYTENNSNKQSGKNPVELEEE